MSEDARDRMAERIAEIERQFGYIPNIEWLLAELRAAQAEITRLQGLLSKLQLNGRPNRKQRRAAAALAELDKP